MVMHPVHQPDPENPAGKRLIELLADDRGSQALFLDVDGTLLDIVTGEADAPVPDGMPALLAGLATYLGGALALVSGREIADIDQAFAPISTACAGSYGAQMRFESGGQVSQADDVRLPDPLRAQLISLAHKAGRIVEDKPHSVAIHFRDHPDADDTLRLQIETILDAAASVGPRPELIYGQGIYEIKPSGCSKGSALDRMMQTEVFSGRCPIMIGDDSSDEVAIDRAIVWGGTAFSVGQPLAGCSGVFDSPQQLRQSLEVVLAGAVSRLMDS